LDMLLLGESVCWTVFEFQTEKMRALSKK
jgi:hypothetical protein